MPLLRLAFALLTCFIHGCTGTFLEKSVTGASEPPTSLQCIDSGFGDPQAWTYISTGELEQFQHMYVMSDFHGRLQTAKDLLKATGLFADTNTEGVLEWQSDSAANNSLVIVIGDFINGGNESIEVVRLFDDVSGLAEHEITEKHVRILEVNIRKNPEHWLWTHRRWKLTTKKLAENQHS